MKAKSLQYRLLFFVPVFLLGCGIFDDKELNSLEKDALLREELAKYTWVLERMIPDYGVEDYQDIIDANEMTLVFPDSIYGKGICVEFAATYTTRRGGFFTDNMNIISDYCDDYEEIDRLFVGLLVGSIGIRNDSLYIYSSGPYNLVFSKK